MTTNVSATMERNNEQKIFTGAAAAAALVAGLPPLPAIVPNDTELTSARRAKRHDQSSEERATLLRETVEDRKAENVEMLDLRGKSLVSDFFLICTGTSSVQIRAIANAILERVDEGDLPKPRVEGQQVGEWILMDFGDVVVHVMDEESRARYKLEEFWTQLQPKGALLPPEDVAEGSSVASPAVLAPDFGDEEDEEDEDDEDDLEEDDEDLEVDDDEEEDDADEFEDEEFEEDDEEELEDEEDEGDDEEDEGDDEEDEGDDEEDDPDALEDAELIGDDEEDKENETFFAGVHRPVEPVDESKDDLEDDPVAEAIRARVVATGSDAKTAEADGPEMKGGE